MAQKFALLLFYIILILFICYHSIWWDIQSKKPLSITPSPSVCATIYPPSPAFFSDRKICLVLLTREGPRTILDTITTFENVGFLQSTILGEKILFLQENIGDGYDHLREFIARRHNFTVVSARGNVMFHAIEESIRLCQSDFFLMLEEDFQLTRDVNFISEFHAAMSVLESGGAQAVRLRHRFVPGTPDYLCDKFDVLPETQNILKSPLPDCYHRMGSDELPRCLMWKCGSLSCFHSRPHDHFWNFSLSPRIIPFTNNPMLYETNWYRRNIVEKFLSRGVDRINTHEEYRNRSMEMVIQESDLWTISPGVTIAKGMGLFTHVRHDRGRNALQFKTNALVCFASNFDEDDILVLANSFMTHTNILDDLVIFVEDPSRFTNLYRALLRPSSLHLLDANIVSSRHNAPHERRFYVLLSWLRKTFYNGVIIHTDARGIMIQKSPFVDFSGSVLTTFEENRDYADSWNKLLVEECIGRGFLNSLIQRSVKVVSVGVTVGNYSVMLSYLEHMVNFLEATTEKCFQSKGSDTGAHVNIFLNMNTTFPFPLAIIPADEGSVTHLLKDRSRRDRQGSFLNSAGQPFSIIHQFDRYKSDWDHYRESKRKIATLLTKKEVQSTHEIDRRFVMKSQKLKTV